MDIIIHHNGRNYLLDVSLHEVLYENKCGEVDVQVIPRVEAVSVRLSDGSLVPIFETSDPALDWCLRRGIDEAVIMNAIHSRKIL